jgi:hypothetical protein
MVLNENIHEFDELEKNSLKDKIKSFFERETKNEKIERLEKENKSWSIRYKKLNTRYKNLIKNKKEVE